MHIPGDKMEASKALNIISLLADGCDPLTGEELPHDLALQQPDTIRALHAARTALEKVCQQEKRKRALPDNAGQPWLREEDRQLKRAFLQGVDFAVMAKEHRRSRGSIISRLQKLGLMGPGERGAPSNTRRAKTG